MVNQIDNTINWRLFREKSYSSGRGEAIFNPFSNKYEFGPTSASEFSSMVFYIKISIQRDFQLLLKMAT